MGIKSGLLLLALCSLSGLWAQGNTGYVTMETASGKLQKRYDKALSYGRGGDFNRALRELEKILEAEPRFIDAFITRAAIFEEQDLLEDAELNYEQVLEIDPVYEPRVWYRLAMVEQRQNKYPEAVDHLERLLQTPDLEDRLRRQAEQHVKDFRFSAEMMRNPVPFEPESLGENINTKESEYLPSFTADGEYLVYTARVNGQEDFMISQKIDGAWQKGEPIEEINTPLNEGAQTISADGRLLVFTACNRRDGLGGCDLYYSEFREGNWIAPSNMGRPVNSAAWESQPSLSADGKALYFASNRQGSIGGRDIWVSYRQADGSWGKPRNLGEPINSTEEDEAPFIHPDGQTLYFMSRGHQGMGGFDLFFARKGAGEQWEKPKNLGYPINTKANEGALVVSLDGKTAYFATDKLQRTGTSDILQRPTTDLYRFDLYEAARPSPVTYVKAVVSDAQTGASVRAKVEFVELESTAVYASDQTTESGTFLVVLPLGKDYALNVSKKGYLFHSENFALAGKTSIDDPFMLQIALSPIPDELDTDPGEEARPVVLRNVFFETGSAELKPVSRVELNRLKVLLEENPQIRIQINGHTDNVGSAADNRQLSENRARAVFQYLLDQGIDENRLSYKGFGESRPIATNETPEGRQQNRRTEFEVIN